MDIKNATHKDIVKRIRGRQKTLKWASKELKKHFVGLDHIINKIIKDIEAWYVMPELLSRPVTICLWGPTGVGKTDLVRRLVQLLGFHDRFCEIEMRNKDGQHGWRNTISSVLSSNPKIEHGKPSILLLDEIQNFRTIDEQGNGLSEYKFRDVWELLSDGKLPFEVEIEYLMQLLWEYGDNKSGDNKSGSFNALGQKKGKPCGKMALSLQNKSSIPSASSNSVPPDGIPVKVKEGALDDYSTEAPNEEDYWSLKRFRAALRLDEPLQEIAKWDNKKKRMMVMDKINDERLYRQVDYTKCLIFISGNLDEAYRFAEKTHEVDIDADIFHELSLKINILDIKSALRERFKPEQIARFGNMQRIYPSLDKKSYETIIARKSNEITNNIKNKFGITVNIDNSINELIYNNGVFPTQGTRPVFSTISEIIESSMSRFLLKAFMGRVSTFTLKYEDGKVIASIGGKKVGFKYHGVVDKLKSDRNKDMDRKVLGAVHEAGHAVAYALLYKMSPPQMTAQPAAQELGGFVCLHQNCGAKYLMEQQMTIYLAGAVAEEMVFGNEGCTSGGKDDLIEATRIAGNMVKRLGMGNFSSYMMKPNENTDIYRTDIEVADITIEKSIEKCKKMALDIFKNNIELFHDTVDTLLVEPKVNPEDFKKLCDNHGIKVVIKKSEEVLCDDYVSKYEDFRKKN